MNENIRKKQTKSSKPYKIQQKRIATNINKSKSSLKMTYCRLTIIHASGLDTIMQRLIGH